MWYGRYNWLWGVLIGMGLALLASRLSYGQPGELIVFRVSCTADNCQPAEAAAAIVTVSPGWIAAGRPTVYVCPSPAEPLANGWRVRRLLNYGAGCPTVAEGIQTVEGWLWFGPTGGGSR